MALRDGRWGLVTRDGREAVPPQFEFVKGHAHGEFFDGMALAFRDGKYGFVNQQGKIAVAALTPVVNEVFQVSRFNLVLKVFGSADEAAVALSS